MAEETNKNTKKVTEPEVRKTPKFGVGDTVRVMYKIVEGEGTRRTQPYEGVVIGKKGSGVSKTFTVRRIGAHDVGVERIFPLHSPNIESVDVLKHGKARRAKLNYLRGKKGKAALRVKEARPKTSNKT